MNHKNVRFAWGVPILLLAAGCAGDRADEPAPSAGSRAAPAATESAVAPRPGAQPRLPATAAPLNEQERFANAELVTAVAEDLGSIRERIEARRAALREQAERQRPRSPAP